MQFYLDAQAGHPMKVEALVSQTHVRLRLYRQLPREEKKTLLLGWQLPTPDSGGAGTTYHVIPSEMFPLVRQALTGLSVEVVERQFAEGRQ
ncbi:hypothetical protein ACSMFT_07380 [Ectopseudomonas oleovorans]|uniref:hypothetical protein n=1 Tax=Ectopseudomonas oleovorans TaxID=301 RepID=UPI003F1DA15D